MYLDEVYQKRLRSEGLIGPNEVVMQEGDLFVAINVVENKRRIITLDKNILESRSRKELLKG
jgi:hypothetical protein